MKKLFLAILFLAGAIPAFAYSDIEDGVRVFLTRDPAGFVDGPNLYTYVKQNPWTNFDPEGLYEVAVTKETAVKHAGTGRSGTELHTHTDIYVSGKVVNESSAKYTQKQMEEITTRISDSIKANYDTSDGKNSSTVHVALKPSDTKSLQGSDTVFKIVDPGTVGGNLGLTTDKSGKGQIGGSVMEISTDVVDLKPGNGTNASLERTAPHELGHSLGLHHPGPDDPNNPPGTGGNRDPANPIKTLAPDNLMRQTADTSGTKVEPSQVREIQKQYDQGNLNK
jgi:hypothetical protein